MTATNSKKPNAIRWFYSVSSKIARIVPGLTLTIVFSTIIAQISLLAASFLPLKAIILIGSPQIPSYFPDYWKSFERETLFLSLSIAAAIAYALYLLAEKTIKHLTSIGTDKLVSNSSKLILFEGQDEVASRAYLRFTRCIAGGFFIACTLIILSTAYFELALILTAFWLALIGTYFLFHYTSEKYRNALYSVFCEAPNVLASIGFLTIFSYLIYDLLDENPPSLFLAIIGLLLARQIMQRAALIVQDIAFLRAQHMQITALFFKTHKLSNDDKHTKAKILTTLKKDQLQEWIPTVINNLTGTEHEEFEITWHQSGVHDVFAFEVNARFSDSSSQYLVKLFNSNRKTLAVNEATLLSESGTLNLPAPTFVGATFLESWHCHIFEFAGLEKIDPMHVKEPLALATIGLMTSQPSKHLVQKFSRSRPFIWDRLSEAVLDQFGTALQSTIHVEIYERFCNHKNAILSKLKELPLQISNVEIGKDHLFKSADQKFLISYWGHWSLEPIGAGWPASSKELAKIPDILELLKSKRHDLHDVCPNLITLSALCFSLDRLLVKQQYLSAAQLLPQIVACCQLLMAPSAKGEAECLLLP